MTPSRVGEQLLLDLEEPWGGISPRYLCWVNSDPRFGGTGRANLEAPRETSPERREVLQLWLFPDDAPIL